MLEFTFALFQKHPILAVCFLLVAFTLFTLWIKRTPWLWLPLISLTFILAAQAKLATVMNLIPLAILGASYALLKLHNMHGLLRFTFALAITVISFALDAHYIPGFSSIVLSKNMTLKQVSTSFDYSVNYGLVFIGLFPLALFTPLLHHSKGWIMALVHSAWMGGAICCMFFGIGLWTGLFKLDLQLPPVLIVWAFTTLFFQIIPQEAFYRGFLQKIIADRFSGPLGIVVGIAFPAILSVVPFYLMHTSWVLLALLLTTSTLLGVIYHFTRKVEICMLTKFIVSVVHLVLFTFPLIK